MILIQLLGTRRIGLGQRQISSSKFQLRLRHPKIRVDLRGFDICQNLFLLHMILLNSDTGLGMSLGETAIVTASGCEPISHAPRQLLIGHG